MLGLGPSREQCREPGSKAGLEAVVVRVGSSYTALGSRKWSMGGGEIPRKQSREAHEWPQTILSYQLPGDTES